MKPIGKDDLCLRVHLRIPVIIWNRTTSSRIDSLRDRHTQHSRKPTSLPEEMYVCFNFHYFSSCRQCIASNCEHCGVRQKMQQKYLAEAHELYDEFFHIVRLPLLTEEVRGPQKLTEFSKMLVEPYVPPVDWSVKSGIFLIHDISFVLENWKPYCLALVPSHTKIVQTANTGDDHVRTIMNKRDENNAGLASRWQICNPKTQRLRAGLTWRKNQISTGCVQNSEGLVWSKNVFHWRRLYEDEESTPIRWKILTHRLTKHSRQYPLTSKPW